MPTATGQLIREHRVIGRVLDALERRLEEAQAEGRIPLDFMRKLVVFSRLFIDRCHHAKEERCLFPCLVKRGIPEEGPIAVMLDEHRVARLILAQIEQALELYGAGRADTHRLLNACQRYLDLLRQHIHKEDHMLFPMGDAVMQNQDQAETLGCYDEVEEREMGAEGHRELLALAEEISSS